MVACSHDPASHVRPPCTWQFWAVEGNLVRSDSDKIICEKIGNCIGLTHADLLNLLECGAPASLNETDPNPEKPGDFEVPR